MEVLYPYAIAVGGVLGMMGLWLVVQRAWATVFAVGDDVLAMREDCGGCSHADHCAAAELCTGPLAPLAGVAGTHDMTAAARGPERTTPRDKAGY